MVESTAFVRTAWRTSNETKRKDYERAHVHGLPQAEVEAVLVAALYDCGWNTGLLMVALRVLQVVPAERVLHQLMAMLAEGVEGVPGGARMHPWLRGHVDGLIAKHPALADAAKRFRCPDWAKPPSQRTGNGEAWGDTVATAAWRAAKTAKAPPPRATAKKSQAEGTDETKTKVTKRPRPTAKKPSKVAPASTTRSPRGKPTRERSDA
jgi:hypothetical protein